MSGIVLQVNFKLNVSPAEYEKTVTPMADAFAEVDGLRWKLWLLNKEEHEAGGIYLFDDEPSCAAFLAGPLAAAVKSAPFLRELSMKRFDVMTEVTEVTRGPVSERAKV
jgi:Putative mono-oxygenase ydhR